MNDRTPEQKAALERKLQEIISKSIAEDKARLERAKPSQAELDRYIGASVSGSWTDIIGPNGASTADLRQAYLSQVEFEKKLQDWTVSPPHPVRLNDEVTVHKCPTCGQYPKDSKADRYPE